MENYLNRSGDSGVSQFEIGGTYISVRFGTGREYTYSYQSAGESNIEQMKIFAKAGRGLNTFINKYVKDRYASKR